MTMIDLVRADKLSDEFLIEVVVVAERVAITHNMAPGTQPYRDELIYRDLRDLENK